MLKTLKRHDLTILLTLYFFLLPIGKTLWYPLFIMAIIGGTLFWQELRQQPKLNNGTKWMLALGACVWIPAVLSLTNTVDVERTMVFVGTYPLFFLAGYFLYRRISAGTNFNPAFWAITTIVVVWGALAIWQYIDPNNPFGPGGSHNQGIHTANNQFVDGGLMMGVILGSLFIFITIYAWSLGHFATSLVLGMFLIGLVMISGTRSAWVSVLFSLLCLPIVVWLRGWRPNKYQLIGIVTLVILGFGGLYQASKLPGLGAKLQQTLAVLENPTREGWDRALSGRLDIWEDAIDLGISSPVVGTGVNNFRFAQPRLADAKWARYFSENTKNSEQHPLQGASHTHQILLEAWSGAGATGIIGLLVLFTLLFKRTLKSVRLEQLAAVGALLALWAGFLPFNTHNNFYGGWLNAWFWVWVGLSAGFIYPSTEVANPKRTNAND